MSQGHETRMHFSVDDAGEIEIISIDTPRRSPSAAFRRALESAKGWGLALAFESSPMVRELAERAAAFENEIYRVEAGLGRKARGTGLPILRRPGRWGVLRELRRRPWSCCGIRMALHRQRANERYPWSLWHRGKFWYRAE